MKRVMLLATVVAAVGFCRAASSEASPPEAPSGPVTGTGCCSGALLSGCPDDYVRKPWPKTWCLSCSQVDDYCGKPWPRIWCLPCGQPDDYCRKPWPNLCRPVCPDYYTCGPAACRPNFRRE